MPSHVGVPDSKIVYNVSATAHGDGNSIIRVHRCVEYTLIVRPLMRLCHPDETVSSGKGIPHAPYSDMSRSATSLFHHLRSHSAFTGSLLARIGRKQDVNSFTCGVRNDIEHVLLQCITYATERDLLFAALPTGGNRHTTVDDMLFPKVDPSSCRDTFLLVLIFFRESGSSNVL